jgi:hypothetical protein
LRLTSVMLKYSTLYIARRTFVKVPRISNALKNIKIPHNAKILLE